MIDWKKALPFILPPLILCLIPLLPVGNYVLHIFIIFFLYLTLAQGWNLAAGYCGQFSLGHQLYFGVSAYVTALLWIAGLHPIYGILVGALMSMTVAAGVGYLSIRLSGVAFSIGTWMFAEAAKVLFLNSEAVGSTKGITTPVPVVFTKIPYYYLSLALAILAVVFVYKLTDSDFGLSIKAIREDELAAESMGVDTMICKIKILMLSAMWVGFVGGFYVYYNFYIEPYDAFSFVRMLDVVLITLIGGIGTLIGPIQGALFFMFLTEYVRYLWSGPLHILLRGVLLILIILFFPKGFWSHLHSIARRIRKRGRSSSPG